MAFKLDGLISIIEIVGRRQVLFEGYNTSTIKFNSPTEESL
jgi:hypothetical protein